MSHRPVEPPLSLASFLRGVVRKAPGPNIQQLLLTPMSKAQKWSNLYSILQYYTRINENITKPEQRLTCKTRRQ